MRVGIGDVNNTPIYAPGSPQFVALNCPVTCAGVVGYNPCCANDDVPVGVDVPGGTQITQAQILANAAAQDAAAKQFQIQQAQLQAQMIAQAQAQQQLAQAQAQAQAAAIAAAALSQSASSYPVTQYTAPDTASWLPPVVNSSLPGQTQASLFSQLGLPVSTGNYSYTTALDGNVYQDVGVSANAPFGWVACPQCASEYAGVAGNAAAGSTSGLSGLLPIALVGVAAWFVLGRQ